MKKTVLWLLLAVVSAVAPVASAAAAEPVVFVDFSWDSVQVHNRIAGFILEHGFGYAPEYVFAESMPGLMAIERGDAHLSMEGWVDNVVEWWEKAQARKAVADLGSTFPDAPQGWYVPTYMIKGDAARGIAPVAPDLKSVADLPKYWELFKDPENPKKGRFYNGPTGWMVHTINNVKLRTYGLEETFDSFAPGSETALSTAIKTAYDRGRPILAYYWEPTWVLGKYDMTLLEEPPYDESRWGEGKDYGCAFPQAKVLILMNAKFAEANPEVRRFLEAYETTLEQNNKVLAFMFESGATVERVAEWFLKEYEAAWTAWLAPEVAGKVRAALEALP